MMSDQRLRAFIERATSAYNGSNKKARWKTPSPQRVTVIERSFHNDFAVLEKFHLDVFGTELQNDDYVNAFVMVAVSFPSRLGADPREELTVEWLRSFLNRYKNRRLWSNESAGLALQELVFSVASKLYKAGVPLDYLNEYHPVELTAPIPVNAVIAAWKQGITPEYARELLGG